MAFLAFGNPGGLPRQARKQQPGSQFSPEMSGETQRRTCQQKTQGPAGVSCSKETPGRPQWLPVPISTGWKAGVMLPALCSALLCCSPARGEFAGFFCTHEPGAGALNPFQVNASMHVHSPSTHRAQWEEKLQVAGPGALN